MSEYNVASNKQYKWTSVNGSYLDEVPRIYAKSYLITKNDVLNTAKAWVDSVKQTTGGISYYDKLHDTTGAETDRWVFPFFNDDVRVSFIVFQVYVESRLEFLNEGIFK